MKVSLAIDHRVLRALLVVASTDDTRKVICGVLVEVEANKTVTLTATDGRRLAIAAGAGTCGDIERIVASEEDYRNVRFIIPREMIEAWWSAYYEREKSTCDECSVEEVDWVIVEIDGAKLTMGPGRGPVDRIQGRVIEGQFPAAWKVVPSGAPVPMPVLRVNPEYVADFEKMARILNDGANEGIAIWGNGNAEEYPGIIVPSAGLTVLFSAHPNIYCVLMPMKLGGEKPNEDTQPQWLKDYVSNRKEPK